MDECYLRSIAILVGPKNQEGPKKNCKISITDGKCPHYNDDPEAFYCDLGHVETDKEYQIVYESFRDNSQLSQVSRTHKELLQCILF